MNTIEYENSFDIPFFAIFRCSVCLKTRQTIQFLQKGCGGNVAPQTSRKPPPREGENKNEIHRADINTQFSAPLPVGVLSFHGGDDDSSARGFLTSWWQQFAADPQLVA